MCFSKGNYKDGNETKGPRYGGGANVAARTVDCAGTDSKSIQKPAAL